MTLLNREVGLKGPLQAQLIVSYVNGAPMFNAIGKTWKRGREDQSRQNKGKEVQNNSVFRELESV